MNSKQRLLKLGLLTLAITVALAVAMASDSARSVAAGEAAVAPEIEGTWLVTVTLQDGPPPFASLVSYARGGALIVTDSAVPPAAGNVYQGTWTRTGAHEFTFTFLGFQFDTSGVLASYIRVHETVQRQPGGQTYAGAGTIEILDLGWNAVATFSHTTHATRVNPR